MKDERDDKNDADRGTTKCGVSGRAVERRESESRESWREQWEQQFRSIKAWPDTKMTRKEARGGRTQNSFEKLQGGTLLLHDELNPESYVYHIIYGRLVVCVCRYRIREGISGGEVGGKRDGGRVGACRGLEK